jgi:hypothetical protein
VNAANYIVDSIKKSAVFADGKIVFKNEDGTTRRTDGRDSTLDDIIGSMAEAEKKADHHLCLVRCVNNNAAVEQTIHKG